MGRKAEPGILFYQLECDHITHRKIKLLYNDFDSDGYWVWQNILSYAYRTKGYFFDFSNEDDILLFAKDYCKKDVQLVKDIIDAALNRKLFDKDIADNYNILTSDRMQEIYLYATSERRRKGTMIEMVKEYLLIEISSEARNISIIPCQNAIVPRNNEIPPRNNNDESTRRRVEPTDEEIKLKELKASYDGIEKSKRNIYEFIKLHKPVFIEPYVDIWNIWAGEHKKAKIAFVTSKRQTHFNTRIKEPQFNFLEIMAKANESKLCKEKSWFSFDFITKSKDNYIKVLEGQYKDDDTKQLPTPVNAAEEKLERLVTKK